jgi:hypothetical protein
MAKKKKLESKAPVPMTRGQLSRAQKERQRIRNLYTAAIAIGTMVVLIIGLAVVSTYIIKPNAKVASVNGVTINRATYTKMRRYNIFQSIQSNLFQQQLSQQTGSSTGIQGSDALYEQLRNVENEETIDESTRDQLIDSEVLRQASRKDFNINPTQEELKAAAIKDFIPQPTPPPGTPVAESPTSVVTSTATISFTPTATATPTRGSPTSTPTITPTLPPVAGGEKTAEAEYRSLIEVLDRDTLVSQTGNIPGPDLSEADYLALIMEPRVRREQVIDKLSATGIMTEVEQIHAQHILTDTEEGARSIKSMLDQGRDFTELANTQSKEQIQNQNNGQAPNGGDLGWFPREGSNLVKEFVEGAWPVQAGKYSDPVKTQFGWHIIKVIERDPKRAVEQSVIDQRKNTMYDDWFKKAKEGSVIDPPPAPTPAPPTPVIAEPTLPPVQVSPTSASSPAPATTPGTPGSSGAVDTSPTAGGATQVSPTAATDTPTNGVTPPASPSTAAGGATAPAVSTPSAAGTPATP